MSTHIHDEQPTLAAVSAPDNAPTAKDVPVAAGYEPPSLTPAGNLLELLGKSGAFNDYRDRRFHEKRP